MWKKLYNKPTETTILSTDAVLGSIFASFGGAKRCQRKNGEKVWVWTALS